MPSLRVDNIPEELKACPQWVFWCYELRGEKWTKVPYNPATGARAKANDRATWTNLDNAVAVARAKKHDGVGFMFSEADPYCGIDLDDCMDGNGQPVAEARELIDLFDSYAEVSPSGRGVKIWVRATLPGRGRRTAAVVGFKELEIYDKGRYFTVTGWAL